MAKGRSTELYRITDKVFRAYQLYMTYFPSVTYAGYKKPAEELGMKAKKLQYICTEQKLLKKEDIDNLVHKLIEKKTEEIKKGKVFRNERIPITFELKKILNNFTKEKGSCRKAASFLNCNKNTYEKYNYSNAKTMPRSIFDKIALEELNERKYTREQIERAYPPKNNLFSPFPWRDSKTLREKYLEKLKELKEQKRKITITKKLKQELIKELSLKSICNDLKIKDISELYKRFARQNSFIYVNKDITLILSDFLKILNGDVGQAARIMNLSKNRFRTIFKNEFRVEVISEAAFIAVTNYLRYYCGCLDKAKVDRILKRAKPKNSVPFNKSYYIKDVRTLLEEYKKRGFGYKDILNEINVKIARSTVQQALTHSYKTIAKPIVDAIYKILQTKANYSKEELEKICNLEKVSLIERPFITKRIRKKLNKTSIKSVADKLGLSEKWIKLMKTGQAKTIAKEKLELLLTE